MVEVRFADIPQLENFPDFFNIYRYYIEVRTISLIVDLVILSMLFGKIFGEGAHRAKLPKSVGAILGFIAGASLSFALYARGTTLLQYSATWIILAFVIGALAYMFSKEALGGWAWAVGIIAGLLTLGLGTGLNAGGFIGGILQILVMILMIVGGMMLLARAFTGRWGLGGLGGGGGGDSTTVLKAIEALGTSMGSRFDKVDERIDVAVEKLDEVLGELARVTEFFTKWDGWFAQIQTSIGGIAADITRQGTALTDHITEMSSWKEQWDKFSENTTKTLAALEEKLREAHAHLSTIIADLATIKTDQATLKTQVTEFEKKLENVPQQIEDLRLTNEALATSLNEQYNAITQNLVKIKEDMSVLAALQASVDQILDVLNKWQAPDLQNIVNAIGSSRKAIIDKIKALDSTVKNAIDACKKKPGDVAGITALIANVQQAGGNVSGSIKDVTNVIGNIQTVAPHLKEMIKGCKKLENLKNLSVDIGNIKRLLVQLNAQLKPVQKKQQRETKAEATELQDLTTIDEALTAEYSTLITTIDTIRAVAAEVFKVKVAGTSKTVWKGQIIAAVTNVKSKSPGKKINVAKKVTTACVNQLEKARKHINTHKTSTGMTANQKTTLKMLDQRLGAFEQQQVKVVDFLNTAEERINATITQTINAVAKGQTVNPGDVGSAIVALIKPIADAIEQLKVFKQVVAQAKRQKATRVQAISTRPRKRQSKKRKK